VEKTSNVAVTGAARPWLTASLTLVAIVAWMAPGWRELFLYERRLIDDGQWWRLWAGHFAHHGFVHLFWNLAVFVPAGVWLERIHPRMARVFLLLLPGFVSAILFRFDPKLESYAGLSGITVGVLTLLALLQLRKSSNEPKWFWIAILLLIAAKMVAEFLRPETAFFVGLPAGVRNVPWAHLAGALGAIQMFAVVHRTAKTRVRKIEAKL
jgi:rhomboid family GlyGly-CTERM serine protease